MFHNTSGAGWRINNLARSNERITIKVNWGIDNFVSKLWFADTDSDVGTTAKLN